MLYRIEKLNEKLKVKEGKVHYKPSVDTNADVEVETVAVIQHSTTSIGPQKKRSKCDIRSYGVEGKSTNLKSEKSIKEPLDHPFQYLIEITLSRCYKIPTSSQFYNPINLIKVLAPKDSDAINWTCYHTLCSSDKKSFYRLGCPAIFE